jgi:SAM-dependent methyltransferase
MDTWDAGIDYEDYMGRWSRELARRFLDWLDVPDNARWIDVGCGTGALADTIAQRARPSRLVGIDPSPGFVRAAGERLGDAAVIRVADARSLPFEADEFDAAVSAIALNFVPDPGAAVREMNRVTAGGGVVAAYVWDYADGMQMIRRFWDTAVALDPGIAHLDEATRFPLCNPKPLLEIFESSGLARVETSGLEIPTVFGSFGEYWAPMLGAQGPIPTYVGSLSKQDRLQLAQRLENDLPVADDGTISLIARAWAVRGTP